MTRLEYAGFTLFNRSGARDGWCILVDHRARWGTLEQVKADAEHARAFGYLPAANKGWA